MSLHSHARFSSVSSSGIAASMRATVSGSVMRSLQSSSSSITASTAAPPTDLVTQPILRGTGAQVAEGDTVTVQYTGFAWTTGEAFESTWTNRSPVSFDLAMVPAWASLVEQPVGSQVMLVVPPTYPLGATQSEELKGQTIVFVIDILATGPSPAAG